jgi:trans-2,3-dihydro-3-hydroxyanthranilate isomerase
MPTLRYRLVNVFAETTFGGNPLAVVEDGRGLDEATMQAIARQFNLSETTFIYPSDTAAARVRIFTPTYEMPFAGHPTLGTASVVGEQAGDAFELALAAGPIPVRRVDGRWRLRANPASHRPMDASPAELAAMLGLLLSAIRGPALWLDCGTEQPMIELASAEDVEACVPDPVLMARFSTNRTGQPKTYVFARDGQDFVARYFWISGSAGVSEDPGTGSACANLGRWWELTQGDAPLHAQVLQARRSGRPSLLTLDVAAGVVEVGGKVIAVGQGELRW